MDAEVSINTATYVRKKVGQYMYDTLNTIQSHNNKG